MARRPRVLRARRAFALASLFSLAFGCPTFGPTWDELASVRFDALTPFDGDEELHAYLQQVAALRPSWVGGLSACAQGESAVAAPSESAGGDASITNNQEQGVDEGDIVKAAGDLLVVLRRGRLFTVRLGDDVSELSALSRIDVTPPGASHQAWYDEMLVHDGRVIVLGYSYELGASELGVFSLDDDGTLAHLQTRYLRSDDYYSSRNYATRLIDGELVIYTPHYDFFGCEDAACDAIALELPAAGVLENGQVQWTEILAAEDVVRPIQPSLSPVLHTVTRCDLDDADMPCSARAVIGPWARSFYVTRDAVYLWVHGQIGRTPDDEAPHTVLYRLPLLEGDITAVTTRGAPVDQFSFRASDEHMNVLVATGGRGDAMWLPEATMGTVELLRFHLDLFAADAPPVPEERYRELPALEESAIVNRFVGPWLLYGPGDPWGYGSDGAEDHRVYAVHSERDEDVHEIELRHSPDRIEVLGAHAFLVGTDGESLVFSSLALEDEPHVRDELAVEGARQGETRSHGFFFRPRAGGGGTLGLPVRHAGEAGAHLWAGSAEVVFLDVDAELSLTRLGALASSPEAQRDDACVVSCTDWYGNARPIFYQGRTYALLGYELVEGALVEGALEELGRVTLLDAPAAGDDG